ncbi:MAG: hypothetical protein ACTSRG_13110 [Candidatus Helarchaeota archaeon]
MTSVVDNVSRIFQAKNNGIELGVPTVFSSIFLQQEPLIDLASEQVTIELYKGNRLVAPLVSRRGQFDQSEDIIRPGKAGVNDYLYALVQQEIALTATELNKRVPGEKPFDTLTKEERLLFWMAQLSQDAIKRVLRRCELLAYQSFFDGEQNIGDVFQGDTKLIFPVSSTLKNRTVAVSWATAASATPWKDLGDALRAVGDLGQVKGNDQNVFSMMSYTVIENLKAIYRSQKGADVESELFYEYDFTRAQVPEGLRFLIANGATYVGWVKTEWGQNPVHIFTTSGMYDDGSSTVDYLTGNTIALCVNDPSYFKSFFGAGTFMSQDESFYNKTFGDISGEMDINAATEMGNSGYPAEVFLPNLYPLGKNQGVGGQIQTSPIFARMQVNAVATLDTTTTS